MLRNALVAATLTVGLIAAPTASAQPKFCDSPKHNIYIHACAKGDGGLGPMASYRDADGKVHYLRQKDLDKLNAEKKRRGEI